MARMLGAFFMVGLLLNGVAAQEGKKDVDVEVIYKKLDANKDMKLSKDEFLKLADNFKDKEKARGKLTKSFEMIDTTKMGVTVEQFRVYFEKARKKEEPKK